MARDHHVLGEDAPGPLVAAIAGIGVALVAAVLTLSADATATALAPTDGPPTDAAEGRGRAPDPIPTLHASALPLPIDGADVTTDPSAHEPRGAEAQPSIPSPSTAREPEPCRDPLIVSFARADRDPEGPELARLRAFARWAAPRDETLLVRGHSDHAGPAHHNLLLSEQRAKRVASQLVRHGVAETRLVVQAFGEHQPRTRDPALNRRVEVLPVGVPGCHEGASR